MAGGAARIPPAAAPLPSRTKFVYGLGDHTLNLSLSALSIFYLDFLIEIAGLRPALAGAVLLAGRFVDAFTDPAMGRLSDATRFRAGRRRPYFLIGMIPFGASFALLWVAVPFDAQWEKFAFYAGVYVLYSVSSTVLAVPYMALLPELALDYQERTSISTYRSALAIVGTLLAAVGTKTLAEKVFGGGASGHSWMGLCVGLWLTLPWLAVHRVSFERPGLRREPRTGFLAGARMLARHEAYRRLVAFYLFGRLAMDLVGAMFIIYFRSWLGRPGDVEITLGVLLLTGMASLPLWLRLSRRVDKRSIFLVGTCWWAVLQISMILATPQWPRISLFAIAALVGIGYAVADMMPWAMLGDVIDEDELRSGERREGVYAGFMTFVRKLAGASGVFVAGLALDLAGYAGGALQQSEAALLAVRGLTGLAPALFLAVAALIARRYSISRARHAEIVDALRARRGEV